MTHAATPRCVDPESVGLDRVALQRMTHALQQRVEAQRLPGVVAMVMRHGQLAYAQALGRRTPHLPDAMPLDAIFRIYSMTKPVVSVATMMLVEQGRLLLTDPVAKYLPEFAAPQVAVVSGDQVVGLVPAERAMTVHDLLRHTAGLTYEILADVPVRKLYARARIYRRDWTNAEFSQALAQLPLMFQPGTVWGYSRATDVLGRLVEVVSGQGLGRFFQQQIFEPLGMGDTGFHVPASEHHRLAEPFAHDPDTGAEVRLIDVREPVAMDMGGGGLVSTAADYLRFAQMLLNGGVLEGQRLLGRKTVELMTSDHVGRIPGVDELLLPGHGFGLGFAVRLQTGLSPIAGSAGLYYWGGMAGTTFFVDPREQLQGVLMVQAPGQSDEVRTLFRNLVYAAVAD